MQRRQFIKHIAAANAAAVATLAAAQEDNVANRYQPTWESLSRYAVPEWYRDAKFGIFIHWGAYCVPAFGNEWYPRNMYVRNSKEYKHHIETYGAQSKFGYKDFIPMFTAEKFNADEWAELFKQAGAKYVVPVAEHHDGFPMYDSKLTDWCAAKKGPRRDVIGELAKAVRKRRLTFGVSSHRAEHWWFFGEGKKFDSDVNDSRFDGLYGPAHDKQPSEKPGGTPPDPAFLDDWLARCCELVDKYRPQVFWFDWWIEQPVFEPYRRKFAAYYYNRGLEWQRGVAINYKLKAFPEAAAVYDIERGQLPGINPHFWQTDTSVSKNSWGHVKNQDYKTATSIVHDLIDIVSKNGCLLLNIGPKPDGTIPEPEQQMLRDIGAWLKVNSEAIYGSRPWKTFGEGPTEVVGGSFNDTKRKAFTSEDVRFTTRDNSLYALALGAPKDGRLRIKSLAKGSTLESREISRVSLLGSRAKLKWTRDMQGMSVELPNEKRSDVALTLKVTFAS